ncbi:10701_t:CDS:1 [Funneliformis geosporum]|uniref:20019_t:CDS:1 n=1 Tax=Funneliformis geosporum TaxID=1117311 RepID=A0A9W4ST90_9GLOM|nr:10701_t:CDS:1 [Funneliformis geosporum]CAI2182205.1 20019_t:CDS:1 [Funneliformis geosporum]
MTETSKTNSFVLTIRSDGETGVDRAALEAVLDYNENATKNIPNIDNNAKKSSSSLFKVTGWCEKGRLADGEEIPSKYPLIETPTKGKFQKNEWNVRDSDGTLYLYSSGASKPDTGMEVTIEKVKEMNKPFQRIYLDKDIMTNASKLLGWMNDEKIKVLNVSGPSGSKGSEIYAKAYNFVTSFLKMYEKNLENNEAGLLS